jgi:hypothetical protein
MAQGNVTRDHGEIRKWAEKRGGRPATVKGTASDDHAGVLRIKLDANDDKLEEISWDEFFEKFDSAHLAFLSQDKTADGAVSRFHKFIHASESDKQH